MKKNFITVISPLRGPEYVDNERIDAILEDEFERSLKCFSLLNENLNFFKIFNDYGIYKITNVKFTLIDPVMSKYFIERIHKKHSFFFPNTSYYLKLEFMVENRIAGSYDQIANLILKQTILLLNLTYYSTFTLLPGVVYFNNRFVGRTDFCIHNLTAAYTHALTIQWPKLEKLEINQTLEWLLKYEINLYESSKCLVGRAINAISYLINDDNMESDTSELFWAMVGIEALFARGTESIQNQIKTKLSIIFGEPQNFKKLIDKLYNYRSRLIHGDIDFPPKFGEDVDNFEFEYWDYSHIAASILLCSIRELIRINKIEFNFIYTLKLD